MITVAKTRIIDKVTGKRRPCKYSDVPKDEGGWVYNPAYIPIAYDLMFLRLKESSKIKSGWWTGELWEGLRLKPEETVTAWKRNYTID